MLTQTTHALLAARSCCGRRARAGVSFATPDPARTPRSGYIGEPDGSGNREAHQVAASRLAYSAHGEPTCTDTGRRTERRHGSCYHTTRRTPRAARTTPPNLRHACPRRRAGARVRSGGAGRSGDGRPVSRPRGEARGTGLAATHARRRCRSCWPLVAIVFQHLSRAPRKRHVDEHDPEIVRSGASRDKEDFGGDVHMHVHGLDEAADARFTEVHRPSEEEYDVAVFKSKQNPDTFAVRPGWQRFPVDDETSSPRTRGIETGGAGLYDRLSILHTVDGFHARATRSKAGSCSRTRRRTRCRTAIASPSTVRRRGSSRRRSRKDRCRR